MNLPEDDLKDFFAGFRQEDERVTAPPFNGLPRRKLRYLALPLSMGIAAAGLLLILFFRLGDSPPAMSTPQNVLVITLEAEQSTDTKSLLAVPDPVSSWESPSASLIADF